MSSPFLTVSHTWQFIRSHSATIEARSLSKMAHVTGDGDGLHIHNEVEGLAYWHSFHFIPRSESRLYRPSITRNRLMPLLANR